MLGDYSHIRDGDAFVIISLDNFEEGDAHYFEDHTKMLAIGAVVNKRVE